MSRPATTRHPRVTSRRLTAATLALVLALGATARTAAADPTPGTPIPTPSAPTATPSGTVRAQSVDSRTSLSITQISRDTQLSGSRWAYQITLVCTMINGNVCAQGGVLRVPLGAAAGFALDVPASPLVKSWSVVGGDLVMQLNDLGNQSGTIALNMVAPNKTTPNDTTWTLAPTVTFTDGTPSATVPTPVTSTAKASPNLARIDKTVPSSFAHQGDLVTYTLTFRCDQSRQGIEQTRSLVLEDTLPAGLTYVSSSPAATTVNGQQLSWTLPQREADICSLLATGAQVTTTVTARVDTAVPDGTAISNTATITQTTVTGQTRQERGTATITTYAGPYPVGTLYKYGYARLAYSQGDAEASQVGGRFSSGAFVGETGDYYVGVKGGPAGGTASYVDSLPCADAPQGQVYGPAPAGQVCQKPAYILESIELTKEAPAGWQPVVTLTDGTTVPLVGASTPAMIFRVPSTLVGKVAAVSYPRLGTDQRIRMIGRVPKFLKNHDNLRNGVTATIYPDATSTTGIDASDDGNLYAMAGTRIGISKSVTPTNGYQANPANLDWSIFVSISTTSALTDDVVITDLLPAGLVPTFPAGSKVEQAAQPDGRVKLTWRISKDAYNQYNSNGGNFAASYDFSTLGVPTGWWTNESYATTADAELDESCTYGYRDNDTADVDSNPATTTACRSNASYYVPIKAVPDAMGVSKWVKGPNDTGFHNYPAVGIIPPAGGSADFRLQWMNQSPQPLKDLVLYDLLPRIGDTGSTQTASTMPRQTKVDATLTSVGALPAGVTVAYSTATNPCRPQVMPDNPGCTDDWTTTPSDLSKVTALRFVSTAVYEPNAVLVLPIKLTMPPMDAGQAAWNTFGAAATNSVTGVALPPVESNKVGITRADYTHVTFAKKVIDVNGGAATDTVAPGGTVRYQVTVTNDGNKPSTGIVVTDTLPAGATGATATYGGKTTSAANGQVQVPVNDLAPGESATVEVTVTYGAGIQPSSTVVNRATVASSGGHDPDPATVCSDDPAASCAPVATAAFPRLVLRKTVDRAAAAPGDMLTYTISVENTGTAPGSVTSLTDRLAAGTTYVSSTPTGTVANGVVTVPLSPATAVAPGARVDVATVTATVDAGQYGTTLVNSASADSASGPITGDGSCGAGQPATTACASTTTVAAAPGVRLVKTATLAATAVGEKVTYTFAVTNTGNVPLTGVRITEDQFAGPAGSRTLDAPPAAPAGFDGNLAPGASVSFTATYALTQADLDAGGALANSATVHGTPATGAPEVTSTSAVSVPVAPTTAPPSATPTDSPSSPAPSSAVPTLTGGPSATPSSPVPGTPAPTMPGSPTLPSTGAPDLAPAALLALLSLTFGAGLVSRRCR